MKRLAVVFAFGLLAACGQPDNAAAPTTSDVAATALGESAKLDKLTDEYFERVLEFNPVFATSLGDLRYNDRFPVDIGKQWLADALAVEQAFLARANELDASQLDDAARLSYDVFKYQRQLAIDGFAFRDELLPINQFYSTPAEFGRLGSGASIQPFTNTKEYDDFLKRVDGFVQWVDQAVANMREGVNSGIVQPRVVVEKTLPQLESFIVADPKTSLFYKPIQNFPDTVDERIASACPRRTRKRFASKSFLRISGCTNISITTICRARAKALA
jgi:uncharacterized protein (DUF885 family)